MRINSRPIEVIDDDTFASATPSNVPSAESVKAYVDGEVDGFVTSTGTITNIHGPITAATYGGLTPDPNTLYIIVG